MNDKRFDPTTGAYDFGIGGPAHAQHARPGVDGVAAGRPRPRPGLFSAIEFETKPDGIPFGSDVTDIRRGGFRRVSAARSAPVHPGTVSWHEIQSVDPDESARFLATVLGAEVRTRSRGSAGEYRTVLSGGLHVAGVVGCEYDAMPGWRTYLRVPNVDYICELALDNGGHVHIAPSGILGLDRRATIADPTGASLTVISGGDDRRTIGAGTLGWDELRSTDPIESMRFWCAVLGWSACPLASPRGAHAAIFLNGGSAVASMQRASDAEPRSRWLPVATIARGDLTAVLDRVHSLGGALRTAPLAHAVLGTEALVEDPSGVEIALGSEPSHNLAAA